MKIETKKWYRFMAPRLTVLVSTCDKEKRANAAPFSFCMPVSVDPPLLAIASAFKRHTLANIRETKQFVINIPGEDQLEGLWKCSEPLEKGEDEIAYAGLTPVSSRIVHPPCIAECAAWFECELEWEKDAGDHVIVVGRVVNAEARDEFVMENGGFNIAAAKPLLHVGGRNFTIGERRVTAKSKTSET